eukprot:366039-Chlamydomonas_euryale.AAC.11
MQKPGPCTLASPTTKFPAPPSSPLCGCPCLPRPSPTPCVEDHIPSCPSLVQAFSFAAFPPYWMPATQLCGRRPHSPPLPGVRPHSPPLPNRRRARSWWEDRFMPRDTKLTTTERVFARDLDAAPSPAADAFTSTQRAVESAVQAAVPPAPVRKPSMFASGDAAVEERLAAYSTPSAIAYMTGRVSEVGDASALTHTVAVPVAVTPASHLNAITSNPG